VRTHYVSAEAMMRILIVLSLTWAFVLSGLMIGGPELRPIWASSDI
jgi:hypothetical protein